MSFLISAKALVALVSLLGSCGVAVGTVCGTSGIVGGRALASSSQPCIFQSQQRLSVRGILAENVFCLRQQGVCIWFCHFCLPYAFGPMRRSFSVLQTSELGVVNEKVQAFEDSSVVQTRLACTFVRDFRAACCSRRWTDLNARL